MLRFISHLFHLNYESCKGCEVLNQQLAIANQEKRDLTETLLNLIKPKIYESAPQVLEPITPKLAMWSRRRAILEESERQKAHVMRNSPLVAKPDDISRLESELGVEAELSRAE